MVKGLDVFQNHFARYADQYVLIGGTAATLAMEEAGLEFRATKDLDIVLHIEALNVGFATALWAFVEQSKYVTGSTFTEAVTSATPQPFNRLENAGTRDSSSTWTSLMRGMVSPRYSPSNTFAGIASSHVPAFILAQSLGALAAIPIARVLFPSVTSAGAN